ncbi:MAG: hypothetical protein FWG11_02530 [Promicromonosporaceae bacterium]|nr:hypothetical protein [Promicromonosporaceae bacterium]
MSWAEIALISLATLVLIATACWRRAGRLDRLHRKVVGARIALDRQLGLRASAARDLVASGLLDPASAMVVFDAAHAVEAERDHGAVTPLEQLSLAGLSEERLRLEGVLSAALRAAVDDDDQATAPDAANGDGGPDEALDLESDLRAVWFRAQLARRFYNEAVAQARRARHRWLVRLFRLAGHAPLPEPVDLDDSLPRNWGNGGR